MSKTIKILQCRKCGEELYRKEEGEMKEADGRWFSNTQVFKIDEKYCSHCTGIPEKENINGKMAQRC